MGVTTMPKLPLCVNLQGNYQIEQYIYMQNIYPNTTSTRHTILSGKPSRCEKEKPLGHSNNSTINNYGNT